MLKKQVQMYCVKLNLVRTREEMLLSNVRSNLENKIYSYRKGLSSYIKDKYKTKKWTCECKEEFKEIITNSKRYNNYEKALKQIRSNIHKLYLKNKGLDRTVKATAIKTKDIISIGDNNLVRTLELNLGDFTDKIITVKVGKMDKIITDKIIRDGLDIVSKDNILHYKFFTAGAGQSRTKKFMMILDFGGLNEVMLALMCGLTIEEINDKGGMNISKFLAYLALNNSQSTVWKGFDIRKCIVVDDFETMVNATVDFVDRQTKEEEYVDKAGRHRKKLVAKWDIDPEKKMDIPIPHMDGLGLILNKKYKKNIQVRLPWMKGLLTYMDVVGYNKEKGYSNKCIDIYDKEWDIVEDGIQIIFTKSQFKLHGFYNDWDDYCTKFEDNNCTANICMQDSSKAKDYKDREINYQMLQQLPNMTNEKIEILTADFKKLIDGVHTDRKTQLEFMKAVKENEYRTYLQEALYLYPELLISKYMKKYISDTIYAAKKRAASGRIVIPNSKRVFILTDVTCFCDWLFGHIEKPTGILKNGEVTCNLYKANETLDVLRSPSLSFEHCLRKNIINEDTTGKWFKTNGIYTSTHDIISKQLMNDCDGDEALVLNTEWIIELVKDMINTYKIRPVYFEMNKAGDKSITGENISKSLIYVYEKSNIGKVSNKLTCIWNNKNPMDQYKMMQKLMAYNNDVIDSAKTLSLPKLPNDVSEVLKKDKYPYFFQYAKNKKPDECKEISNSAMDRICSNVKSIRRKKFSYNKGFGKFNLNTLLNINNIEVNQDVINKFKTLEKETLEIIDEHAREFSDENDEDDRKKFDYSLFYSTAREEFLKFCNSINIKYENAVDMIIKYSFTDKDTHMMFLFNTFGAVICNNLRRNIKKPLTDGYMMCDCCGKRIKRENNNQKMCHVCSVKATEERNKNRNKNKNTRSKKVIEVA